MPRFFLKSTGGVDLATTAMILGGIGLIAVALVGAATLLARDPAPEPGAAVDPMLAGPASTSGTRASVALSTDHVATVLFVDAAAGAGSATRPGDRVDVLGYFSRQVLGSESTTRTLLQDVAVLTADHSGPSVALTLAVPQDSVLLLQEALAIGARPFVTLRSGFVSPGADSAPLSFSDTDLAERLAGQN